MSFQRIWGHAAWRKHYKRIVTSWDYLKRAFRGKIAEKTIVWHRADRVDSTRALSIAPVNNGLGICQGAAVLYGCAADSVVF
jgi:hypothetical protein